MANVYRLDGSAIFEGQDELDELLPGRLLVWHDEFLKPEIDPSKWNNVWGMYGTYNWNSKNVMRNISCGKGMSLWAAKDYPNQYSDFSAAYITTNNLFEFRYGRIEAKIRFPSASPHHSTLWTMGACSELISTGDSTSFDDLQGVKPVSCGEIDIAEFNNDAVGARTHWDVNGFDHNEQSTTGGNVSSMTDSPSQWHVYSCEWTESTITFYCDGVQKSTWNISNAKIGNWNPFEHPHYIILNCISKSRYDSGTPINWDIAKTDVAWVRVYAPVGVTSYVYETNIDIPSQINITVGERYFLSSSFTPSNASDMTLKWESYNPEIATCYGGMVIGKQSGYTIVKVTTKHGCVDFCKVTVTAS